MNPHVSIIIPAHNEQEQLQNSILKIIQYCERNLLSRQYEIVIVENGSTDRTWKAARDLQATFRPVRAFQIPGRSKAQAVCYGMKMSHGEYRYMCDCDLSTPIGELTKFLKAMEDGWDIIIGSRERFGAKVETTFKRWFIGRVFSQLVTTFTGLEYKDTQCGFKLFHARAALDIFERVQCTSMAFDVEVLYLAQQLGYYCTDMPVIWQNAPQSRVRLISDSWLMFRDLLQVRKLHSGLRPAWKQKIAA